MSCKHSMAMTALVGLLGACAGGQTHAEDVTPRGGPESVEQQVDPSALPDPDEGLDFDEDAAKVVLERGKRKAAECPRVVEGTPTGEGEIEVVFDGPAGRIVDVKLGAPFSSGSPQAQSCLQKAFIGEIIPPFDGQKTVTYTLSVPAPAQATEPEPKSSADEG